MFSEKAFFKDKIIKTNDEIWELEGLAPGKYDEQARAYDKLISNPVYNRIMWGSSPKDYRDFAQESLNNAKAGLIIDIGCGTLGFTANVYSEYNKQDLILSDLSAEMLKIGKDKLKRKNKQNEIYFLRADAFNMPITDNSVDTIMSFGILHIFSERKKLLSEFKRILKDGGQLQLSSLCTDRKFSAWYLGVLNNKGHVSQPLSSQEITELLELVGFTVTNKKLTGAMLYISAKV